MRNNKTQSLNSLDKNLGLKLYAAREHNLKNIDLTLEHDQFTAITGVSGSGKSTLAFDTIYAEGGRRYIETFSPYTRQFLDRLHRPDLDNIEGVRPALALEQRNRINSARSTVGTSTEINDYLKIIWSNLTTLHCPDCECEVLRDTPLTILSEVAAMRRATNNEFLVIMFGLSVSGLASAASLVITLQAEGFIRFYCRKTGTIRRIDSLTDSDVAALAGSSILVIVDRIKLPFPSAESTFPPKISERARGSFRQAYDYGHGQLYLFFKDTGPSKQQDPRPRRFTEHFRCTSCDRSFPQARPSLFSFNSPLGACRNCHGFGKILSLDPQLCIPNPTKTINEGAIACWNTKATARELRKLKQFCRDSEISLDTPWTSLTRETKQEILHRPSVKGPFKGMEAWFRKLERKRHKVHVRVFLSRYRSEFPCPDCRGSRLTPDALLYTIEGHTIADIWQLPLSQVLSLFEKLVQIKHHKEHCSIALEEVISRLRYLTDIGLNYLSLDRQSRTLSGGESQRVNLTSILGARLVHTILILDEPTIGLHSRDTARLISTLKALRDRGNSVIAVEHDTEVIRSADQVVDLGPKAGNHGGEIVFQGSPEQLANCSTSITGEYLNSPLEIIRATPDSSTSPRLKKGKRQPELQLCGARAHNLQNIDVTIPLQQLVVLTGVSGSGKTTLIHKCLDEPYQRLKQGVSLSSICRAPNSSLSNIKGLDYIDDIVFIDQAPLGKSPRSNPATYTKVWTEIRQCLADTPSAVQLGLSKSAFSFNVEGGRCPLCSGAGQVRIEMQFLADVFVQCEACGGSRFQDSVLTVRFKGKNVLDFLEMSIEDTTSFFSSHSTEEQAKKVIRLLQPLLDLGLGYLRLGHPLNTVSGGEAQRIKLASYLTPDNTKRCLFVLDEPTTGLHPYNIADLLKCFDRLLQHGHSLLVVEHNLDVIRHADWIVDLGPEGGEQGGCIVAEGTPSQLIAKAQSLSNSHTAALLAKSNVTRKKTRQKKQNKTNGKLKKKSNLPAAKKAIEIIGARHHNLKDISVGVPHNKLTVVTGVSGSGKSTLAFDIVFAEGQRRYIDCLSPYARQYIKQLARADVDRVNFLPPTIAISQKSAPPMGISTVATTTEIYQYLRLLYAKAGVQHCTNDNSPVTSMSFESITTDIARRYQNKRIFLFAPVVSGRKGYYNDLFNRALKAEITKAKIDGEMVSLHPELRLARHKLHWISLLVGTLSKPARNSEMLRSAVEQCLLLGNGAVEVTEGDAYENPQLFSIERVCPSCGRGYRELDPQDFSFRSARGVCQNCGGRGRIATKNNGSLSVPCPECEGSRIAEIGRHVYMAGKRIDQLTKLTPTELLAFFDKFESDQRLAPVIDPILSELRNRLSVIISVGLDYLELDRNASSISGGEAQRLRLARALGSPLSGVCYVLDEPSIGLHPQDHAQLMQTLLNLRDRGNTLVVVEHDEDTIRQADHIIDVGPRGGALGGRIVAQGSLVDIEKCSDSLTGSALKERSANSHSFSTPECPSKKISKSDRVILRGAHANNLKKVEIEFPIEALTVVAGVSGAGKSSLVHETLVPAVVEAFQGSTVRKKHYQQTWSEIKNTDLFDRLIEIDQSPVGKTSTSTPASYLGIFNDIRKLYAMLPEAKARGCSASYFSFNTGAGRCPECHGRGFIKVPMSFLPEAVTLCEVCNGLRYTDDTIDLVYQGVSIGEVLQKTISQAREIFSNHKAITRSLDYVLELGLGYLSLGQATHTLSGGEAQRLKIARELGKREAKRTLYILDEPTIGLHMVDVEKLISVLRHLISKGNSVIVIEHNLDVIRCADFLIELGPGPGEKGGKLLFSGPPEKLLSSRVSTPTKHFLKR